MCGICGISVDPKAQPYTKDFAVDLLKLLMVENTTRGRDATGVVYMGKKLRVNRGLGKGASIANFIYPDEDENQIIAHMRYATIGNKTSIKNVHPFETETYIGMHNGSLINSDLLQSHFELVTNGTCDSEVVYRLFDKQGVKGVQNLEGTFTLVFIDKRKPQVINIISNGSRPMEFITINRSIIAFGSIIKATLDLVKEVWDESKLDYKVFSIKPGFLYKVNNGTIIDVEDLTSITKVMTPEQGKVLKTIRKLNYQTYQKTIPLWRRLAAPKTAALTTKKWSPNKAFGYPSRVHSASTPKPTIAKDNSALTEGLFIGGSVWSAETITNLDNLLLEKTMCADATTTMYYNLHKLINVAKLNASNNQRAEYFPSYFKITGTKDMYISLNVYELQLFLAQLVFTDKVYFYVQGYSAITNILKTHPSFSVPYLISCGITDIESNRKLLEKYLNKFISTSIVKTGGNHNIEVWSYFDLPTKTKEIYLNSAINREFMPKQEKHHLSITAPTYNNKSVQTHLRASDGITKPSDYICGLRASLFSQVVLNVLHLFLENKPNKYSPPGHLQTIQQKLSQKIIKLNKDNPYQSVLLDGLRNACLTGEGLYNILHENGYLYLQKYNLYPTLGDDYMSELLRIARKATINLHCSFNYFETTLTEYMRSSSTMDSASRMEEFRVYVTWLSMLKESIKGKVTTTTNQEKKGEVNVH